jgi:peptidoglycan/LPS O-acetylase OafA/YrhL
MSTAAPVESATQPILRLTLGRQPIDQQTGMRTDTQDHPKPRHIAGLDGLRALSVIAVVWHHAHPGLPAWPMTYNGFLGVDVFFALSGFLITTLLLEERAATGRIALGHFYMRRSLRIFPLYYALLALLAIYFLATPGSPQGASFLQALPLHLAYLSNWVPVHGLMAISWSLAAEEQFYLLWPPLLVLLGRHALWPLLAFLAVNLAVGFGHGQGALQALGLSYEALPILQATFTPILLGVLLAYGLRVSVLRDALSRAPVWALPAAVLMLLWVANIAGDVRGWQRLAFALCTIAVLALVTLQPGSIVVRSLQWRPLAYIGTVSYGMYLLHKIALHVVRVAADRMGGSLEPLLLFASGLALSIALAALSYRFFEQPILRLKSRFQPRAEAPQSSATNTAQASESM